VALSPVALVVIFPHAALGAAVEIILVKRLTAAALAFSAQDASLLRSFKQVTESPSRSQKPSFCDFKYLRAV